MRRITLDLRQGLLILLIVWGLFTTLVAAAERLLSTWHAPGLIALAVVAALEAIITQRLVVRERRRLEEQAGVRLLELVIIVLLVRLWSLLAQGESLPVMIGPWLREPLRFFGGRFAEYFLWALAAWGLATLLAADVLAWGGETGAVDLPQDSIEREQMQQEWGQTVARYDRRFVMIVFVTLAAAGFALNARGPGDQAPIAIDSIRPAVAAMTVVVAGMLLHSTGQLGQLRRNWSADNIDVAPDIDRRWNRSGLLIMLGLVLLAPVLGRVVLIAPPPPLVPIVNALLVVMTLAASLMVLLLSLLMAPLVWLLSSLSGGGQPASFQPPRFQPPQIAEPRGDRPLWPALIFWGCVLLLIGIALVRYFRGRSDLRDALLRWRLIRWLFEHGAAVWSDARGWAGLAATTVRRLSRRRARVKRPSRPRGAKAQLRALYRRMREAGTRRGVAAGLAQTPYEFGAELGRALPAAREDVRGLTDAYVVAEYGPMPVGPSDVNRARRHWRRLQRWLRRR